jgi:hypothetical protein
MLYINISTYVSVIDTSVFWGVGELAVVTSSIEAEKN